MPGLPGSDKERDLRMVERLVSDPDYRPDMMKFYTCLVMENTPLHDDYASGDYVPYSTDETVDLLVRAKSLLPPWIRTMRIQRDIPTTRIAAGVMSSNMGQMVEDEMRRRGTSCQCIRCREIGLQSYKRGIEHRREDVKLVTRTYDASGGTEVFLSYEDERHDALIGFLRLRIPGDHVFRREITEKSALVRELHVYGPLAALGTNERDLPWWQHQGYGKKLLGEAERIAHERYGAAKMVVISGIGVREYYRSQGYRKEGPYVTKLLP
jgi:elongator complex protein 3